MEIRIGVVAGSRVDVNGDGTEEGRILQAVITDHTDVQNIQTCQPGEEYNPPNGCQVMIAAAGESFKVALAFDDTIAPIMEPGGRRIYATDPDGEAEVAELRLHPDGKIEALNEAANITVLPDGTITAANGAASITMSPAGVITFHGASAHFDCPVTMDSTLAVATSVTAPSVVGSTDVTAGGKALAAHRHTTTTTGAPTSVPL